MNRTNTAALLAVSLITPALADEKRPWPQDYPTAYNLVNEMLEHEIDSRYELSRIVNLAVEAMARDISWLWDADDPIDISMKTHEWRHCIERITAVDERLLIGMQETVREARKHADRWLESVLEACPDTHIKYAPAYLLKWKQDFIQWHAVETAAIIRFMYK